MKTTKRTKTAAAIAADQRWRQKPEVKALRSERQRRVAQAQAIERQLAAGLPAIIRLPRSAEDVAAIREKFADYDVQTAERHLYITEKSELATT